MPSNEKNALKSLMGCRGAKEQRPRKPHHEEIDSVGKASSLSPRAATISARTSIAETAQADNLVANTIGNVADSDDNSEEVRLLLIDDAKFILGLLSNDLRTHLGVLVDTAFRSDQGLKMMCTKHYHLVLCDLNMPHMDGLQTTRSFREWQAQQDDVTAVTVVGITGHSVSKELLQDCRMAGIDDVWQKSPNPEEFQNRVRFLIPSLAQSAGKSVKRSNIA